jgi:hypothetical protein
MCVQQPDVLPRLIVGAPGARKGRGGVVRGVRVGLVGWQGLLVEWLGLGCVRMSSASWHAKPCLKHPHARSCHTHTHTCHTHARTCGHAALKARVPAVARRPGPSVLRQAGSAPASRLGAVQKPDSGEGRVQEGEPQKEPLRREGVWRAAAGSCLGVRARGEAALRRPPNAFGQHLPPSKLSLQLPVRPMCLQLAR